METTKEVSTLVGCCYNFSTGYLEDALIQFSVRFKRQRVLRPENFISAFHYSDLNSWSSSLFREEESKSMEECSSRKKSSGVVYPFAMVKPGGIDEGVLTLDDINKKIMMAPRRAVRHPVGDYACHSSMVSTHHTGISGKEVVAFTKIQTQGTGTITIIRTKG